MTKAQIKKLSKAAGIKNGHGGARPGAGAPRKATDEEREALEKARSEGRSAMPEIMRTMVSFARAGDVRAAQFVANRCGMPEQKELKIDMPDSDKAAAWLEAIERG